SYPTFELESLDVIYMTIPDASTGACPAGTTAVYRLWNARSDTNHRYTIDPILRAATSRKATARWAWGCARRNRRRARDARLEEILLRRFGLRVRAGDRHEVAFRLDCHFNRLDQRRVVVAHGVDARR